MAIVAAKIMNDSWKQPRWEEEQKFHQGMRGDGISSTHIRGELGAVDVTLLEYGGVSVRSFMMRTALAMDGIGAWRGP